MKVLIVDDQRAICTALEVMFEHHHIETVVATGPAEVLDLWRGASGSGGPWRVVDVGRDAEAARSLLFGAGGTGPVVETARARRQSEMATPIPP